MAEGTGDAETPAPPAFPTPHDEAAGAGGTPALDAREHARDWRHRAALYGAVAALAVAVRLALFLGAGYPQRMAADGRWYDRLGRDFAENLRFVKADGTPNTQKPPLYPAFVATVYLVFGRNPDAVRAIQVVMAGATAALAAAVALRLFGSYPVAAVTGGLLALYRPIVKVSLHLLSETLAQLLFAAFFLALVRYLTGRKRGDLVVAAALLPATIHVKAALILVPPVLAVVMWAWIKRPLKDAALFLAVTYALVAPWCIRNTILLGRITGMRAGLAVNLYVGYEPEAKGWPFSHAEGGRRWTEKARRVAGVDDWWEDRSVDHKFRAEFRRILRERPVGSALLVPRKAFIYWGVFAYRDPAGRIRLFPSAVNGAVLVLTVCGIVLAARRGVSGWRVVLAMSLYCTAVHALTAVNPRYSYVLLPATFAFAALCAVESAAWGIRTVRSFGRTGTDPPPPA